MENIETSNSHRLTFDGLNLDVSTCSIEAPAEAAILPNPGLEQTEALIRAEYANVQYELDQMRMPVMGICPTDVE